MLSSVQHLFQQLFSRKRKAEDVIVENSLPRKQIKFSINDPFLRMEKENVEIISDNDEVSIIKDVSKPQTRRSERSPDVVFVASTPLIRPALTPSSKTRRSGRTFLRSGTSSVPKDEVEHLTTIRHIPIQRVKSASGLRTTSLARKFQMSSMPSLADSFVSKSFRSKRHAPIQDALLEEKMRYRKLLEMYDNNVIQPVNSSFRNKSSSSLKINAIISRTSELSPSSSSSRRKNDIEVLYQKSNTTPPVKPINSLEEFWKEKMQPNIRDILKEHALREEDERRQVELENAKLSVLKSRNEATAAATLEDQIQKYLRVAEPPAPVVDDEEEAVYFLPALTPEQEEKVTKALVAHPGDQVLIDKFGYQITRKSMQTLNGLNWLNDEVINFYMTLIMERAKTEGMPKVYAFNTFFHESLKKGGYARLKRWTRKVDLFSMDLIVAPVHRGMHWCMSAVDFGNKEVRYYDSMDGGDDGCLDNFLEYLKDESMDKKKVSFDTSGWKKINVKGIPQQMNGSDCGVFSCMFAEHLARESPFGFTQANMPYFRRKMVIEILEASLLT